MKKITLIFAIIHSFAYVFAQTNYVNQYVLTSGGNFLSPGNKVKLGVVNGNNLTYIDSVSGDFSNVVKIQQRGRHAHAIAHIGRASGNDLLVWYDLDTYARLDSIQTSGVQAVATNEQRIVIAKGYGALGHYVDIHDANTLEKLASIPEIENECTDVAIRGNKAYVSHSLKGKKDACAPYGCFSDSVGYLSILDLNTNSLVNTINLGTKGAGIKGLIVDEPLDLLQHVYFSNGKDSLFELVGNTVIHNVPFTTVLAVTSQYIFGLKNTVPKLSAMKINKLNNQEETPLLTLNSADFSYGLSAKYDTINHRYLVLKPNYTSEGWLLRFTASQQPDSIKVGQATTAIAIDYRIGTIASHISTNENRQASVYPNPFKDILQLRSNGQFETWEIKDMLANRMAEGVFNGMEETIHTEELPKGFYLLVLKSDAESVTHKIVKE